MRLWLPNIAHAQSATPMRSAHDGPGNACAAGYKGTLWILESDDLTLRRTIRLDWGPYRPASLLIDGETLYITAHEGNGENGSILAVEGWAPTGHP